MTEPFVTRYRYYLKQRTTGEIIELGYVPTINDGIEKARKKVPDISMKDWKIDWEFCFRKGDE